MENLNKLSIQVSLSGLSFCIYDTKEQSFVKSGSMVFPKQLTPYGTLKKLSRFLEDHNITSSNFSEVVVTHRNNLFGFVPKIFFDSDELANYIKLNAKILANDHMAYDELETHSLVNVYVPFVNINNYIFELFGAFTFKHHGTVMVESLLQQQAASEETRPAGEIPSTERRRAACFVYIFERQMDITVLENNSLLLYNNFSFITKEDFLYYLLFTIEQLGLDVETVSVKLFGDIEEDDDIYRMCYEYIRDVVIFVPSDASYPFAMASDKNSIDFTVLNAL